MAAKKKTRKRQTTKRKPKNSTKYDSALNNLLGIVIILLMLLGLFNLGAIGTLVANLFRIIVGQTYPLMLVIITIYAVGLTFKGRWPHFNIRFLIGGFLAYIGLLLLFHGSMFNQLDRHSDFVAITWTNLNQDIIQGSIDMPVGGGMIGAYLYQLCYFLVSNLGTTLLAVLLIIVGIVVFFDLPVTKILNATSTAIGNGSAKVKALQNKHTSSAYKAAKKQSAKVDKKVQPTSQSQVETEHQKPVTDFFSEPESDIKSAQAPNITVASDSQKKAADKAAEAPVEMQPAQESENTDYQLPSTTLLTKVKSTDQSKELNAIKLNTKTLQDTLASFGVDAKVENVNLGPSVTKYELRPAVGVKVSRIVHLADDLALALAAKDIRIEAPIPGKSLIGIEVPNRQIATVGFRDMIEATPKNDKMLEVPLGRAVNGQVMTADLTKMPHLLIAGATGSGKSVAINVIITSILLKAKPHQVKFLMIDPKKVELSVYNGIPHLLSPVVSEPKRAAKALAKVVGEMERRYELFAGFGVRNIDGYNKMVRDSNEKDDENQPYLPLILVIVDELADLMMTVSNDVEDAIVRIAQMGRAAGIHMILATQRPSVDVITGLIKANVPSRMAFAVSSGIDSRTILDSNGAEKLLGRGDMLFMPIDQNKPVRVQGAFISDHDVEAVVDFIKQQQTAQYDETMVVKDDEMEADENKENEDELFDDALAFVVDQQRASTSLIQRRFRIGYNRAARMIDEMEQRGFIGPSEGSKPRQVYKEKEE
ncbi:cell division protein FtsK [Paucilactobacillus hokkaidonensis JCM 18461]|uniref:DNA translocase FtsK n=2 Tax=Paucilactobacillus hokkaidonensis TaxID=1193095 RepID=A0A0A1GZN1_9LACO|nr:DNA translocase FtsK [Paucilactobacillus hokkaidonensis]KRO09944.1 cell division protein FtsK [Paucilactobacillus hokkaidonensis]BAP85926.1 cell division protein FtsK [Paucilactobacillus hokkaidonensis JCM 18461]